MNDYAAFNEVYKKFFSARGVTALPARACFAVIKLPFGAKVTTISLFSFILFLG